MTTVPANAQRVHYIKQADYYVFTDVPFDTDIGTLRAIGDTLCICVAFCVETHQAGLADDPNPLFNPEEPLKRMLGVCPSLMDLPFYAIDPFVILEDQP